MTPVAAPRRVAALVGAILAAALLGAAGPGVLGAVAALFPRDLPPHPYLVPEHAALLYAALPLAVLGVLVMLLAPGLLLALAAGGAPTLGRLMAMAFAGTCLVRGLVHHLLIAAGIAPFGPVALPVSEVVQAAALVAVVAWRVRRGGVALPEGAETRRRIAWMVLIPVVAVVLLLPVLFWQDITEDGLEALEIGRSIAWFIIPRFPTVPSGLMGLGLGMQAAAYPTGWFVALMGPVEAAARLPLLLYLPILFAVLTDLAEFQLTRRLGPGAEAAIVATLACYTLAMVYSCSYTPYSADAAIPAANDTMAVVCIAATVLFAWDRRTGWVLVYGLLGYLVRPTELMLLGLLAIGSIALPAGERRWLLPRLAGTIVACVVMAGIYEKIVMPALAHGLPVGYVTDSIVHRMRYLTFTDIRRVLYAAVPGGILPAAALFLWRRQDPHARQLAIVCVLYFLFFYVQAFISMHHYIPAMLLPVAVYWRVALSSDRRWPVPAALAAAALAFGLSLPRTFAVDRSVRAIGRATEVRVGDLNGTWAESRATLDARRGLHLLFGRDWEVDDPARERVGSAIGIVYYGARFPRSAADTVNYVVQPADSAAPAGFTPVGATGGLMTFVRDSVRWRADRDHPPRTDWRASIYAIPRTSMHNFLGIRAHAYQLDVGNLPGMWRFFR